MSQEEKKIQEEQQAAEVVMDNEHEAEVVGNDGDLDWNDSEQAEEGLEAKVAQLEAALLASEARAKENHEAMLRALADVDNMRRRSEQEIDKARKFALGRFVEELLPVLDNLERAIQAVNREDEVVKPFLEGVELTHKTFVDTVGKFGVNVINPEGEAFNPEFHQAMSIQESADHPANTVMMVMQKGYELNGRVVRPAMVMVAK